MTQLPYENIMGRLIRLEADAQIRNLVSEYMHLCDDLSSPYISEKIGDLFTEDAIWEGIGALYKEKLGKYDGRNAIVSMMDTYIKHPPHFLMNVHFLNSQYIEIIDEQTACGRWKMLQTSTFNSNVSHLNCAELNITFSRINDTWLISHFMTKNIFSRPVSFWHSEEDLQVPNKQ